MAVVVWFGFSFLVRQEGRGTRGQDTGLNAKLNSSKNLVQEYTSAALI